MISACADAFDSTAENAARPPLLPGYIQAAYLLPASMYASSLFESTEDDNFPPVSTLEGLPSHFTATATACLSLFQEAMLARHSLQTRLTSCACLLRLWADDQEFDGQADYADVFGSGFHIWLEHVGVFPDIVQIFQTGLEVRCCPPIGHADM